MATMVALQLLNEAEAKFECTYGRGCDGICCQNGRPGLYPDEIARIQENYAEIAPHLRAAARELIAEKGMVTRRIRDGLPLAPVVDGWCVFFNAGCVLHKVGAAEGDKYKYKPVQCSLFPLMRDDHGNWYIRQQGYKNEPWNLFCLAPTNTTVRAVDSLQDEMEFARRLEDGERDA